jgi:integrase
LPLVPTFFGMKTAYGYASAGRRATTERQRRKHPDGYVPLHRLLSHSLRQWHRQKPYGKETDFVFSSMKANGKLPLCSSPFVADHLRLAAISAEVQIAKGRRFGLHNLRHSLSNWLVSKAKVEPKTVQSILRHSKIQTTLDLYTKEDSDEARAAQGAFLAAVGLKSEPWQDAWFLYPGAKIPTGNPVAKELIAPSRLQRD